MNGKNIKKRMDDSNNVTASAAAMKMMTIMVK